MIRDLLQHKPYLIFWSSVGLVFLVVSLAILWELHRIAEFLKYLKK